MLLLKLTLALELFGVGAQLLVDFRVQVVLGRLVGHGLVQFAGHE